jgi:hypothetical protein
MLAGTMLGASAMGGPPCTIVQINEIRIDQPGDRTDLYFELIGPVDASLEGLSYVVVGAGSEGGSGVVQEVVALGGLTLDQHGLLLVAEDEWTCGEPTDFVVRSLDFVCDANVTHMLVSGFTGAIGLDLDTDDNGLFDCEEAGWESRRGPVDAPWLGRLSAVSLVSELDPDGIVEPHYYGYCVVGPADGRVPAQAYRCVPSGDLWLVGLEHPLLKTQKSDAEPDTPGRPNPLCPCAGDLDGSGTVDVDDLHAVIQGWGESTTGQGDVDHDGVVDMSDLLAVIRTWGACEG